MTNQNRSTAIVGDKVNLVARQTSVYRYFDKHNILLYVGISSSHVARNQQHNADKGWWSLVASQSVGHFPDRASALSEERQLIVAHCPPFNTQHNPNREASLAAYSAFLSSGPLSASDVMATERGDFWLNCASIDLERRVAVLVTEPRHLLFWRSVQGNSQTVVRNKNGSRIGGSISMDQLGPYFLIEVLFQKKAAEFMRYTQRAARVVVGRDSNSPQLVIKKVLFSANTERESVAA